MVRGDAEGIYEGVCLVKRPAKPSSQASEKRRYILEVLFFWKDKIYTESYIRSDSLYTYIMSSILYFFAAFSHRSHFCKEITETERNYFDALKLIGEVMLLNNFSLFLFYVSLDYQMHFKACL